MAQERGAGAPRSEMVASAIKAEILSGGLPPGTRLRFSELSSRLGASVGVLREALIHLVEGGLVESESNLGFRVLVISDDRLAELMMIRRLIEPQLLRQSVLEGSLKWETGVVAARHVLERLGDHDVRSPEWRDAHLRLHVALVAGTGSPRFLAITEREYDETDLYVRWAQDIDGRPPQCTPHDHQELVEAALAHDATRAANLLRQHIERRADQLSSTGTWEGNLERA